jgi:CubicO group peptidase (beta-lactamase class C family)
MRYVSGMARRLLVVVVTNMIAVGGLSAAPAKDAIDSSVRRAMEVFDAPGMTVSIVHKGELVHSAGYGDLAINSSKRVDDATLFQIGSVSKAFTAASLAILADEGKLGWDDLVIDYLPEFRMYDAWVTREFTIRDLLTHRSGLPLGAGDLLMFPDGNATPAEIVHALRYLKPATSFRSEFAYDNLLYIVAGEVVARVADMPFQDFLEKRLLARLGMRDCVASPDRAPSQARVATAHMVVDGQLETTSTRVTNLVAAAGGITCNARSMARWCHSS